MTQPAIDFWFDFASTYSYVTAMRIAPLAQAAGVTVRWRPFLLGPIFQAQGMDNSPFALFPVKGRYMWRDIERLCDGIGTPFLRPSVFPQSSVLAARVALIGLREGWGEDFSRAVFRAEFAEGFVISDKATIERILSGLDLNAADVLAAAQSEAIKAELRAQTDEAARLDIFGAPTFIAADREMFWGNDRLEQALQWAVKAAVQVRPA
jgi:2-hydroxychromene-2-carboxylate isomerase